MLPLFSLKRILLVLSDSLITELNFFLFPQAIDEDGIQKNSEVVGTYFLEELLKIKSEFLDVVGDVRGKGLMIGVEMVTDKVSDSLAVHNMSTYK